MSEFNNRISAQRDILLIVNSRTQNEELFGMSAGAIDRWAASNFLRIDSVLLQLVRQAASKLFFLANKSQEQITHEYRLLSEEVSLIRQQIANAIEKK